ncbi:BON domain-containing protein [Paraburkholderia sp. 1N]|uniref:BON domain-containing protein n=1 Tax=Paraburkholderia solitsugae TaxID=2675748 RepID=A0ABX2BRA0_9BURK|nr:BON domain-containing protein [Paraburkholderia solitsugae]
MRPAGWRYEQGRCNTASMRDQARRAAWSAPGVHAVIDNLTVG